jgi:hypothetical protein
MAKNFVPLLEKETTIAEISEGLDAQKPLGAGLHLSSQTSETPLIRPEKVREILKVPKGKMTTIHFENVPKDITSQIKSALGADADKYFVDPYMEEGIVFIYNTGEVTANKRRRE